MKDEERSALFERCGITAAQRSAAGLPIAHAFIVPRMSFFATHC
jgi:hypothetical protein